MLRRGIAGLITMLAIAAPAAPRAQSPSRADLDDLLGKASDYAAAYARDFIGVVAEEEYRQDFREAPTPDIHGFRTESPRQTRTLRSDMLLVRAPAGDRWLQFRDVFEVDGKPVRDREERLATLFLQPSPSTTQQIEDIKAASARYNIGDVRRDLNLPVLAMSVFDAANRPWFVFGIGKKKGGIWELEYREERGNTMIRGRDNKAMPAHGAFKVERATGRILASELRVDTAALGTEIDVTYDAEPAVGGLLVPREMREKYVSLGGATIEGRARYTNYRRYTVTVGQALKKDRR